MISIGVFGINDPTYLDALKNREQVEDKTFFIPEKEKSSNI